MVEEAGLRAARLPVQGNSNRGDLSYELRPSSETAVDDRGEAASSPGRATRRRLPPRLAQPNYSFESARLQPDRVPRFMLGVVAMAASFIIDSGWAEDGARSSSLEGYFRLGPCEEETDRPCRFYLELHGEAARALYENMRSEAAPDECTEGRVKIDREMLRCFRANDGDYICDVGYDFDRMDLVFGDLVC
jgi:hypothetical protein